MWPLCSAAPWPPRSVGMVMPGAMAESEAAAGAWPPCSVAGDLGFVAVAFVVVVRGRAFLACFLTTAFFVTGLAGIGIVMPGMVSCCADAGVASAASASALTVTVRILFT